MSMPAVRDGLHREIANLRQANELLVEQVRQLTELLTPPVLFPRSWKLTAQERRLMACLYGSQSGFRSKEALHAALSPDIEVETDEKLVDVIICRVRAKLPPWISIETVRGEGFSIPRAARSRLAAALGHPTEPAALMETIRMSFDVLKAPTKKPRGGDASVLLRGFKSSSTPQFILSFRGHFAVRASLTSADTFNLQIGRGEKKGFIRLVRDKEGGFKPKPLKNGAISINCGHIERFGSEAEPKENVRADIIDKDTVEIVLPKWSDEIED